MEKSHTISMETKLTTGQITLIYSSLMLVILSTMIACGMASTPKIRRNPSANEFKPEWKDPNANSKDRPREDIRRFRISGYCSCEKCTGSWSRIPVSSGKRKTASGYTLKPDGSDRFRICAADKSIPFGTKLRIPGVSGEVVVEDRGGAIRGNRIDLYCGSDPEAHRRAQEWGVQYLECRIIQ